MPDPLARPRRIINFVNFIRYDEPRHPDLDLLEPIVEQMKLLRQTDLPCTWLLQFDALSAGPYVDFLRQHAPATHEIGLWFEINRMHCDAAGVAFRGREGLNWDYHVQASLSVGYSQPERRRLADVAMERFRETFGRYPRTVAAWYIDAFTLAHLADHYEISSFAICRDQYGTDGYTLWGGPFSGGYYPARANTMLPAQHPQQQIGAPVFRLLGSDPIHQYDVDLGKGRQGVITLEPVYPESGGSQEWVGRYLDILAGSPTLAFTHAQAGQENSFGWQRMGSAFTMQVEQCAVYRDEGRLTFECLGDTGDWFKKSFPQTPAQSLLALTDTLGGTRRSVWYHSKYYRVNLLLEGDRVRLRDLHVFREGYRETYYDTRCDTHAARFDALPILDGYGWSTAEVHALGRWMLVGANGDATEVQLAEPSPQVEMSQDDLLLTFPLRGGGKLFLACREHGMEASLMNPGASPRSLRLDVRWAGGSPVSLRKVLENRLHFSHQAYGYDVAVTGGYAAEEQDGFSVSDVAGHGFSLDFRDREA